MTRWAANSLFNTTDSNKLEEFISNEGYLLGKDKQASALFCELQKTQ